MKKLKSIQVTKTVILSEFPDTGMYALETANPRGDDTVLNRMFFKKTTLLKLKKAIDNILEK